MALRFRISAALAAQAIVAATTAGAVNTIRPGYWSTTNTVSSPIHTTKTENRCITPKAIQRFTTCYINHHYRCTCPDQSNADGRIIFRGDCVDAKGRHVEIDGEGAYTATTLRMSANGRAKFLGLWIPFATHTDSHWLSDTCPPGSPGSEVR